jgi:quinoprotein glucose dehydrogenase
MAGQQTGVRNFGGPIVTGQELEEVPLPVPAVTTPMTYTLGGRQYIVVAAGGHGDGTVPLGDSLMVFAVS